MQNPNQSDDYLNTLISGNKQSHSGQVSQAESDLLQNLVMVHQAKPLSGAMKQRIWQKAQANVPKKASSSNRILRLVAGVIVLIGVLIVLAYPKLSDMNLANTQQNTAATEVILENTEPILRDVPEISSAFGFEYGGYTVIQQDVSAGGRMQATGMNWVALPIVYGSASLESISEQISVAHQYGFKIMLSVTGSLPSDADEFESYLGAYADFLAQVASAGADAIEIWPEANLNRTIPEEYLGAEHFALILEESIRAIRASKPETFIISGAPAPTGAESAYPGQVINDDNFLRQLMDLGALDTVDCVGVHYQEGIVPPLATTGDSRDDYYSRYLPTTLQTYRQIVEARIPLCFTVMGYLSLEGVSNVPTYFEWAGETSRQEQMQWTSDAVEWLSLQTDVPLVIIWNIDTEETGTDDAHINDGFSLLFGNGE